MDKLIWEVEGLTKSGTMGELIKGSELWSIDFESLANHYDAMWLTETGEISTRLLCQDRNLYGWDCESVLIFNKECIK